MRVWNGASCVGRLKCIGARCLYVAYAGYYNLGIVA
jgi:hypothetical protein